MIRFILVCIVVIGYSPVITILYAIYLTVTAFLQERIPSGMIYLTPKNRYTMIYFLQDIS